MKYSISRLRRPLASFALALTVLVGGAGSVAAASPAPSPTPKVAVAPKTTTSPAPTPGTKTGPAPTHATPSKPQTLNKTLAKVLATRNAATATLAGPTVCTDPGTTVSYDLYASAGIGSVGPLVGVNYWGFSTQPTGALLPGDPAATLYMCQADTLSVTLHDNLLAPPAGNPASNAISLEIPAANVQPDVAGTTTTKGYTFSGLAPGTYLYEAGPTPGGARQVGMGLAGLLIVRPTAFGGAVNGSSAYGTSLSQFTDESTLAVAELSTEFSDDPYVKDLHEYAPNLFLVNGQPFSPAAPNTIPVAPGDRVLLHEANLGLRDHSLTVLGHRQSILADDSHVLTNALDGSTGTDITTKFLTPGQVADSFISIDAKAQTGFSYPIFDAGFHFNNDNAGGLGGMLAQLSVATGVGGLPTGPATTNVSVSPPTNAGTSTLTVTANLSSAVGLSRAEWFVDNVGVSGSGCDGAANVSRCVPGVSGLASALSFTITWADFFAALLHDNPSGGIDGDHVIWIHAQDSTGIWGTAAGDVQSVNVSGPGTSGLDLHSSPTNPLLRANDIDGSKDLVVWSAAMSSLADWTVLGAYACVDSSACNTSPAGTPPAGAGLYNLYTDPPATGSMYNANYGVNGDPTVHPSYVDLPGVYYFSQRPPACTPLPTPGPAAGLPDAVNEPGGGSVVSVCGVLPASALQALTTGVHTLYVHSYEGQNFNLLPGASVPTGWGTREGAASVQTFVIDRTGPAANNLAVSPNPNNGFQNGPGNLGFLDSVRVSATLDDSAAGGSAIANAEVFLVPTAVPAGSPAGTLTRCDSTTAPPASATGSGAFMIPSSGSWSGPVHDAYAYVPLADIRSCQEGLVVLWVHGQDVAGNWGDFQSVTLTLDKTVPTVTTPTVNTVAGVSTLTATADDPLSNGVRSGVVGAEWFTGADPGPGNGLPVISNPAPPPIFIAGNHVTFSFIPGAGHFAVTTVVSLRVIDGAGNWSAVKTVPVP
jgi:hypothetical protein